jgi:hypothetical protein
VAELERILRERGLSGGEGASAPEHGQHARERELEQRARQRVQRAEARDQRARERDERVREVEERERTAPRSKVRVWTSPGAEVHELPGGLHLFGGSAPPEVEVPEGLFEELEVEGIGDGAYVLEHESGTTFMRSIAPHAQGSGGSVGIRVPRAPRAPHAPTAPRAPRAPAPPAAPRPPGVYSIAPTPMPDHGGEDLGELSLLLREMRAEMRELRGALRELREELRGLSGSADSLR